MAGTKHTAAQIATLRLIESGFVYQPRFGYGAWRIQGAPPTVVGRLVSLGLAEWLPYHGGDRLDIRLTKAGVAALAKAEGSSHA